MEYNTASCNTWMSLGSGHQGAVLGEVLSTVPVEEGPSALDIIKPYYNGQLGKLGSLFVIIILKYCKNLANSW